MTEQERALYYTDDGIRKKLPRKEKLPFILSAVMVLVNLFFLYGIVYILLGSGLILGCVFFVCLALFIKRYKVLKSETYRATYENSHDAESWKAVYKKNRKFILSRFLISLLLLGVFCLTGILRY